MSWNNVDDKHKKKFDRDFVSCEEDYEREYIIELILKEFPHLNHDEVERAVGYACRTIKSPRPRKEFLECVKDNIGKV